MDFDKDTITNYRKNGYSFRKIATIYGVGEQALRRWKQKIGFADPIPESPVTCCLDADEIANMRRQGMTYQEIADQKGMSAKTLHTWRKRTGFVEPVLRAKKQNNCINATPIYQIKEEYINGATIPELMEKYNKSYQSIYNYVLGCKPLDKQIKEADHGKTMALLRAGWTVKDVAEDLRISEKAVVIIARKAINRQKIKRA